jgi:hypothetical protein
MIAETDDGFRAYVEIVEDRAFDGLPTEELSPRSAEDYHYGFLIVADRLTITDAEHPLLVLDLFAERGRSFRALPTTINRREQPVDRQHGTSRSSRTDADEDGVPTSLRIASRSLREHRRAGLGSRPAPSPRRGSGG